MSLPKSKISLKLILSLSIVALAASLFVVFTANAGEGTTEESNADFNLLVVRGNKSAQKKYSKDTDIQWRAEGSSPSVVAGDLVYKDDVIQNLQEGKVITGIDWKIDTWRPNHMRLWIDLKSSDSMIRTIWYHVPDNDVIYYNGSSVSVGASGSLSPNTANKFTLGEYDDVNFVLSGAVKDGLTKELLPYATIRYFDPTGAGLFPEQVTQADANGHFSMAIPVANVPGYLEFTQGKCYQPGYWLVQEPYYKEGDMELSVYDFVTEGLGSEHINYHIVITVFQGEESRVYQEYDAKYFQYNKMGADRQLPFTIDENGAFKTYFTNPDGSRVEYEVTPVIKDGFVVDKWTINDKDYAPDSQDTIDLQDNKTVLGYTFYRSTGGDTPEPMPAEEVNAIPQTGDNTIPSAVALGILVAASAIAVIASRKRRSLV